MKIKAITGESTSSRPSVIDISTSQQRKPQLEEVQQRYKKVKREINAWQKQFAESNGRDATSQDKKADPNVKALYSEYKMVTVHSQFWIFFNF